MPRLGAMAELIKPLPIDEWEGMHIQAEHALIESINEPHGLLKKMSDNVFAMSDEIRRLRLTYGEPVWFGVNTSQEEDSAERARYEALRKKNED